MFQRLVVAVEKLQIAGAGLAIEEVEACNSIWLHVLSAHRKLYSQNNFFNFNELAFYLCQW